MIKALIFDCFGVFYPDPVFAYMRDPAMPADKARALHSLDEQAARGALDKNGFVTPAASLLGISAQDAEQQLFHSNDRNEQLAKYVQELRKRYKVAMLSNIGGDMMDGFFTPQEREELFDVVILSGDVKRAKPDKAIFEFACRKLGVSFDETIMIDDVQITCDIVRTFGMHNVCYKNFAQCRTELDSILQ
jgi:putative hydrolase of the HAD superfamily